MKKLLLRAIKLFGKIAGLFLLMFLTGNSCGTKKETSGQKEAKIQTTDSNAASSFIRSSPLFVPDNRRDTQVNETKEKPRAIVHNSENQSQLDSIKKAKDKEKGIKK